MGSLKEFEISWTELMIEEQGKFNSRILLVGDKSFTEKCNWNCLYGKDCYYEVQLEVF